MAGAIVMVTGAAGNLGRAVVAELTERGHHCVCVERSIEALEGLVPTIARSQAVTMLGGVDLGDQQACVAAVERTLSNFGKIDALVNTVGGFETGPVNEDGLEQWDRLFQMPQRQLQRSLRSHRSLGSPW